MGGGGGGRGTFLFLQVHFFFVAGTTCSTCSSVHLAKWENFGHLLYFAQIQTNSVNFMSLLVSGPGAKFCPSL